MKTLLTSLLKVCHPFRIGMNIQTGFSLVEVMLILVLLSVTIVPFTLMISQSTQTAKGLYISSSQKLLLNRLKDESNPEAPNYGTRFVDASINGTVSESGQVLPFMRVLDTTNTGASDTFQKTVYTYLYRNTTDPVASAFYKVANVDTTDEVRLDLGNSITSKDSSGRMWYGGDYVYSHTILQPGEDSTYTNTTNSTASDIVNTQNDMMYQNNRANASREDFEFDVKPGFYTVKLYIADDNATTTATSPNRRVYDLYLENTQMNSDPYEPYSVLGGTRRAQILMYDIYVSDGVLNVSIRKNSLSDLPVSIAGIAVQKRTMQ